MKKMAKRFFSSVIVLAMLIALLPATVSQAAALVSTSFESESELFKYKTYGSGTASWDNTTAYSGSASMKFVQNDNYVMVATYNAFSYGKTYRVSARVKIDNQSDATKTVNFETYGGQEVYNSTSMNWNSTNTTDSLRLRSDALKITDSEWHLLTDEFTVTKRDDSAATIVGFQIGIETQGSKDTIWVDDFSIVEVPSISSQVKVSYDFEDSSQVNSMNLRNYQCDGTYSYDTTQAYSGTGSFKTVQRSAYTLTGDFVKLESGKTYRATAMVKFENPVANSQLGFELWSEGDVPYTATGFSAATTSRLRNALVSINDTEWHKITQEFTFNITDTTKTSVNVLVGIYAPGGTHTLYVDDYSIVEVDTRVNKSFDFEAASQVNSMNSGSYQCDGTYTHDTTEAYSGTGSIKTVQRSGYTLTGAFAKLESGKTYRATAMVKISNPVTDKSQLGFELWSKGDVKYTATNFSAATNSRWRNNLVSINDTEWHKITQEFTFNITDTSYTGSSVDVLVGVYAPGGTHTLYVDDYSIVDVEAIRSTADVPEISMDAADWKYSNTGASHANYEGEENALFVTKAYGYGVLYQDVKLNDGQEYLLKAKFYVPEGQVGANTKIELFVIDGEKTIIAGEASHTMTNNSSYGEVKYVQALTAEDEGKWISVALPFTFAKPSYDTDNSYRVKPIVTGTNSNDVGYYLADVKFVDPNTVNIDDVVIGANGTVTYTANDTDYILSYKYLDGTTVLASGKIFAGEFLPKFDLADVEEPIVKLTATNAYGEEEATVTGTKAVEETPDIGGDEEEGVFDVNSVTILDLEGDGVTGAQDISEISKGMYVDINYINSTEEAKQVWLMMAYYNADGLIEAKKYVVDLAVSADAKDEYYPAEPDDIPYVEGATVVKAFVWDIDGVEPLCEGYVVD